MSGANEAFLNSEEEPDDSFELGKADVLLNFICSKDTIIAIVTSKNTNYINGILEIAQQKGIKTILISSKLKIKFDCDVQITIPVEENSMFDIQKLSTNIAHKFIINTLLTSSMAKIGKTYKQYLIDFKVTTPQRQKQAVDFVMQIAQTDEQTAIQTLKKCKFRTKVAIVMLIKNTTAQEAVKLLKKQNGILRKVIE